MLTHKQLKSLLDVRIENKIYALHIPGKNNFAICVIDLACEINKEIVKTNKNNVVLYLLLIF